MSENPDRWSEADSRTFIDLADVAVPGRREQLEMLLSLLPALPGEPFTAADLGCGEGILCEQILERFPQSRVLGFDGSQLMREKAAARLAPFGQRADIRPFDLESAGWLAELPSGLRAVTSSLAFHHLDGGAKRRLFRELTAKLEPGGALLIADVVAPATDLVRRAFASALDTIARQQSLDFTGSLEAFRTFQEQGWNAYKLEEPVPGETPSRLFEQLRWLEEAGLSPVDCFWMRGGVAVYGGYR